MTRAFGTSAQDDGRVSGQRLRSVIEASGALVLETDDAMALRGRNREWETYTGQSLDQYQGHGWLDAVHPDEVTLLRAMIADAIAHSGRFQAEARLWHGPTGMWRHHELRMVPCRAERTGAPTWVAAWLDVHARRAAEEALRASDRRKDEFLAIMTHELRNPLAPLMNSLEILRSGRAAEPLQRELVDIALRQGGLLVRLVDDLMEASRLGRGVIELRREPVRVAEAIGAAVEISRTLIDERRQRLQVHQADPDLQVLGDRARLTQIVANLLTNAAKYTPPEGLIEVRAGRDGAHATIVVADNGSGIPPQMLSRVFELFTQLDPSPERSHGGLGIGLSLVERLVHLHGGSVEARSEGPGRGSEFTVRLPLLAARHAGDGAAERRGSAAAGRIAARSASER